MPGLPIIDVLAETTAGIADAVEIVQRTTYHGPLTVEQAALLGVALSLLCGLSLWAESRFTGRKWLLVFWPLRVVVVAVAMWMLAEPTQTTIERRLQRKSLALAADISGSMDTVDSPDPIADFRWATAVNPLRPGSLISSCDQLVVAAAEAQRQLAAAQQIAQSGRGFQRGRVHLETALRASESSLKHLQAIERANGANTTGIPQQSQTILAEFRDHVVPGIRRQSDQAEIGDPQARTAALRTLTLMLERASEQTRRLATAAMEAELAPGGQSSFAQTASTLSRRDKVAGLLNAAESGWLRTAEQDTRIQRWAFHREAISVKPNGWLQVEAKSDSAEETGDHLRDQNQPATDLAAVLEQLGRAAASDRLEAVVLISDGRHNAVGKDPLVVAGSLGRLPIYIVPVGDDRLIRDIVVHHLDAPRAVDRDDKIVLESLITAIDCEGEPIEVQLIAKDRNAGDEVIDQFRFTPDAPRLDQPVTFTTHRSELGRYEFAVRSTLVADEASADNNQDSITVDVIENNIKVLLADNFPRWEFRFLSRLFERDEHIQYDQLTFHPDPAGTGELANEPRLPSDLTEWSRYRVVVLGDLTPPQLPTSAQQGLREYVTQHGGTLILIAGSEAMPAAYAGQPLLELLPVTERSGSAGNVNSGVVLTAEGRMSPSVQVADDPAASERVWREAYEFVPLQWMSEYRKPKPTAHTLLTAVPLKGSAVRGDEDAFLCWQPVGRGRVVYFSAPATYRLRARHGDRHHHAFWGQLLRWSIASDLAAGSKTVRVHTDKRRYDASEAVQVTVQLQGVDGEPVRLAKVQAAARQHAQIVSQITLESDVQTPGRYLGKFDRLPAGHLLIEPMGEEVRTLLAGENYTGTVNAEISVYQELNAEMKDTRSNPALLARIAEITGGQVITPTALSEIVQLAALAPETIEKESHRPLWDNWWCLWLISGCLIGEWFIRKQRNLL